MPDSNAQEHNNRQPKRRQLFALWGLMLLLAVGVAVDRFTERGGRPAAFAHAERIWVDRPVELDAAGEPSVFWAIKDFTLTAEQVELGAQSARLVVLGDPSALVYWNGLLVHASEFRAKTPIEPVKVGPLLARRNRVVIEARSDVGTGGLMAALWLELPQTSNDDQIPVWVTDQDWQIAREYDEALLAGLVPLSPTEDLATPKRWPGLDLGRWRPLAVSDSAVEVSWPSRRLARVMPEARAQWHGARFETGETEPWPDGVVLTFESPVQGCLGLGRSENFRRRVFFFDHPSALEQLRGPKDLVEQQGLVWTHRTERVLPMPGSPVWVDSSERRFKAVFLEGIPEGVAADGASAVDRAELLENAWVQPCAGVLEAGSPQRLLARR